MLLPFCVGAQKANFQFYTTADGLSGNFTHGVTQDNQGFIWVLNDYKLHRFDGRKFVLYTPPKDLPGSNEGLKAYLAANLIYPEAARKISLEGTVQVLVVISPDGKVQQAQVIQSLGQGCDEAALRMIMNMPKWTPAMNYGVPVKGKKVLEIAFKLQ